MVTVSGLAQSRVDYKKTGAPIPPFAIKRTNGKVVSNAVLQKGKPVLVAIFSPECEHCERALDTLHQDTALKSIQAIWVTQAVHEAKLKPFMIRTGFDKDPLFRNMGTEQSNLVFSIYTYGLLPQFNVYSRQHKLVKTFTGIFPLDSLKMYLGR